MISIFWRVLKTLVSFLRLLMIDLKYILPTRRYVGAFSTSNAPSLIKFYYHQFYLVFAHTYGDTLRRLNFLPVFYFRNNLLWADGFLIDFLQKKTADLLTRKFFLFTGFLFSERFIFEIVLKLYLDTLVWPLHALSLFEAMNTIELLANLISFYFLFFSFMVLLLLLV